MMPVNESSDAYLTISSVHSHVSGNSLRTFRGFFLGCLGFFPAEVTLRPSGTGPCWPAPLPINTGPDPPKESTLLLPKNTMN